MSTPPLASLLATLTLLFTGSLATEVTFAPESESEVIKTFTTEAVMEVTEFKLIAGTLDLSSMLEESAPKNFDSTEVFVVTDRYLESADGRPTSLLRTFDSFEGDTTLEDDEEDDEPGKYELFLGKSVLITWDEDEEAYEYELEGRTPADWDADNMRRLSEDMDLRALLPSEPIEDGDEWEIELTDLGSLITPGFDPFWEEDPEEGAELTAAITAVALEALASEVVTCTFVSVEEPDGVRLARIDFILESDCEFDFAQVAQLAMDEESETAEMTVQSADVESEAKGEGTVWWNLDANRLEAMDFHLILNIDCEAGLLVVPQPDIEMEMQFTTSFSLDLTRTVTFEE